MPNRLAFVILAVGAVAALAIAVVILARPGGSGEPKQSTPPAQSDYLQRAADLLSLLARDDAVNRFPLYYITPEAGWVDQSAKAVDVWDKLVPPPDLEALHRALGRHMHKMVTAYQSERFGQALTFDEPWNKWWNAAEDQYGVSLFQVLSPFMEPTICHDDVLVIPPTDGALDRWQLAVLKRGPSATEYRPKERPQEILRVVGLPGESILVNQQGVFVNGQLRTDDVYAVRQADYSFGPVTVPEGKYFLLGDKRWKAIDSRNSGVIGAPTFYGPDRMIGELPASTRGCVSNLPSPD